MPDLDRYQYGYDFNSNRLYKGNVVAHAAGVFLDEAYTYDNLNRLTVMQRGNLALGVITGTPSREMDYTLDPTGNWKAYLTKTSGTTDLSQGRASNKVNEITNINASTGSTWVTPLYDPAGNMTTMPQPATPTSGFVATYDAWNRMTSLSNSSGGASVASYQYDGRGRRIVKTTPSETRHFYYTNAWQDIEERTGTSTSMDKQYVWGLRYVDELVCRDDATPQRLYAMQDANFNLTSICGNTSSGVLERYLFDPYGTRTIMNASWGAISSSAYNWSIGHQGLMEDQESGLVYNRRRLLSSLLGTFISRDPLAHSQGSNFYLSCKDNPFYFNDPTGLECCRCGLEIGDYLNALRRELLKVVQNMGFWDRKRLVDSIADELIGWDIFDLAWDDDQFKDPDNNCSTCNRTVTVFGQCYKTYNVNYFLWGAVNRALVDASPLPNALINDEDLILNLITAHRMNESVRAGLGTDDNKENLALSIGGRRMWAARGYEGDAQQASAQNDYPEAVHPE